MDYNVPWDDFTKFDLIILSREGREYIQFYHNRDADPPNKGTARWLTPEQEQKFEDYVNAGGRMFCYHDGFSYPKGNAISRVAKAFFVRHPQIVNIEVSVIPGKMPEITEGIISPFTVADEEYQVEMDEKQTTIFLESHAPEHGRAPQGWAHAYGKGKVAILIPGHNLATINHPMIQRCQQNILRWLTA
jgi:type 1 glutamine amidotransferase